jgi:multidrug transporter EmrE-like cation transporter
MNGYIFLGMAIVLEIFSTSMLKASAGFTKLIPSGVFIAGMSASFYVLSQALNTVPLSIAYAIWSGVGTAITALVAVLVWKEQLNIYTVAGMGLIIIGVVILNLKGGAH